MRIKVSLVEDAAPIRESVAILLNGSPGFQCISTFPNAELAVKEIPLNWPDVVLMDINLPKASGIECVAMLKALNPALQIIMLTVYADNDKIFKSLKAGASGYLLKQTPPAEILKAISDVHEGGSPMSNSIARKIVQIYQRRKEGGNMESLSRRELEILTHLAKCYQYKEIAA